MKKSLCVLPLMVALAVLGVSQWVVAQDDEPVSSLTFLVLRDYNGKPIKNAAVVLHPVTKGKQDRGGLELKTNTEGRTGFEGVPYGILRVQVLAQGFQTFGEDYDINKPDMEITIKLKRPQGQYSVYDSHSDQKKDEQKPPDDKKPQ